MSANPDRLYDLMPVVYRMRDAEIGYPLRDFLRVMTIQANLLEADITRLYNNWFIETCDDWVVPYIGDLLGYTLLPEAQALGEDGAPVVGLGRVLAPRADVANTIDARRRKGTLALLDDLARDAAGWPARAVEFYRLVGWMQHLDHPHRSRGGTANVRDPGVMQRIRWANGAFDPLAHSVDVRRMGSHHRRGRYAVPDLGLFVFRLRSYPVTTTAAYCVEEIGLHCYAFSVLGNDTPLYQRPDRQAVATTVAQESQLPVPLRRYRFADRGPLADYASVSDAVYGDGRSVLIYAPDWPSKGQGMPVSRTALIPADLSGWRYPIPKGRLAVDPERGRLMFPANGRPKRGVWVTYQYGFGADLGGGEYARTTPELDNATRYIVHTALPTGAPAQGNLPEGHFTSIAAALAAWQTAKTAAPDLRALVIELAESGVYDGSMDLTLAPGEAIQVRAADRARPVLRLLDTRANQQDALSVSGGAGSRLLLDGLMVVGRGVEVHADADDAGNEVPGPDLCELVIRHCTLVPGWTLHCECDPRRPGEPSVTLDGTRASLRVEHSIIGPVSVISPPRRGEPPLLSLCDSVVDATGIERVAIGAPDEAVAYVTASIARCTVIGAVQVHGIQLAEDSIFLSTVRVLRRQQGCVRFCYVPGGSRTPQRFHCQPDLAVAAASSAQRDTERRRVTPLLRSLRYATPDYVRLHDACCPEIRSGASDGSAMGVYHDLYEPQREASLAVRIQEYVPANSSAGILFAS